MNESKKQQHEIINFLLFYTESFKLACDDCCSFKLCCFTALLNVALLTLFVFTFKSSLFNKKLPLLLLTFSLSDIKSRFSFDLESFSFWGTCMSDVLEEEEDEDDDEPSEDFFVSSLLLLLLLLLKSVSE